LSELVEKRDPHCRGVVVLWLDAPLEVLCEGFNALANYSMVEGFAVGNAVR